MLWRRFTGHPLADWVVFGAGLVLLAASPIIGAIPGPGGIIVAGIGLALILRSSSRARRHYVRFKRWQPRAGRWTDLALRRRSARRRQAARKAQSHRPPQAHWN